MDNNFQNQNNIQPEVQPTVQPVQTVAPVEPIAQPTMEAPMQPPTVTPVQPQVEKKKKNIVPVIVILVFIIAAAGGIGAYFLFFGKVSGKQVLDGTVAKIFGKATVALDKVYDYVVIDYKNDIVNNTGDLVLNADIKTDTTNISYKNIKVDYDAKMDLKNLQGSVKVSTSQDGKDIVDLQSFLQDKVLYVNSGLFDTPYKYDLSELDWKKVQEYINNMPEYNSNTFTGFLDKTKIYVQNAIKPEYITQTEGNFTIEGVSFNGLKNSLVIDETKGKAIYTDILTAMKNDDQYLNQLSTYTGESVEKLKKDFEEEIKGIPSIKYEEKNNVTINIYTSSKGDFLALEAVSGNNSLTAVSENEITTFRINSNNKEVYKFTYNEREKEYTFNISEGYVFKVKFIENGVKLSISGEDITADISLTKESKDKAIKQSLESNLKYNGQGTKIDGSLKFTSEIKKAEKIDTFVITTAKNIDTVEPEEIKSIITKLEEKAKGTYLESYVEELVGMTVVEPIPTDEPYIIE